MIFYPEFFSKPVKNSTSTWDLNTYLDHRKRNDFSYPSAPQMLEELPEQVKTLPVTIQPGEILCFSRKTKYFPWLDSYRKSFNLFR